MAFSFKDAVKIYSAEDFAKRLLVAGWTRKECPSCNGVGWFDREVGGVFDFSRPATSRVVCEVCNGQKTVWEEPAK